jgi:hypothetical protein
MWKITVMNCQETRHSSIETFAVSIESDSLNRDRKDDATDKRKRLGRTKSVDDVTAEKVRTWRQTIFCFETSSVYFPPASDTRRSTA